MSSSFFSRAAAGYARLLVRRPGVFLLAILAIGTGSLVAASDLGLNTNQLELIDQDMREVREVERIVDMVGGAGHFIIGLRGAEPDVLKAVSDDLADMLAADDENVRTVTHKLDISFLRDRAALFLETEDLEELRRRVDLWLRDQVRRADPFFFEIRPTEPVQLEL
ncbi:MAG: export protein, partial [Myxococcota bacterium]